MLCKEGAPPIVVHNPNGGPGEGDLNVKHAVRISYHRRMYGLGEVIMLSPSPTHILTLCPSITTLSVRHLV